MNLPINLGMMELLNSPVVEYSQRGFWEYLSTIYILIVYSVEMYVID